jgi:signal transduction histidine kinase
MPSSFLSRLRNSLAFRLTLWYAGSFIIIGFALSIISYFYLSSAVRDNRKIIQSKLKKVTAVAHAEGAEAIGRSLNAKYPVHSRKAVFIRVLDDQGNVRSQSYPEIWDEFSSASRGAAAVGVWQYVPSSRDRDVLELTTVGLPGGYLLQAGKEIQDRKEILERYRETIIGVTCGMILIGLAGGAWLAFRALKPVRDITAATRLIVATGNVNARVPERGRGDELDGLTSLFNQMLARTDALIAGMRDALDNVAHDLRTPLTRLRGVAELALRAEDLPEQPRDALASCIEESDRILALLNSLMDISEAETGAMRLHLESVDVASLIHESVGMYEFVAEEKNIAIAVDCPPEVRLTGDRARMRQIVANLLDNAIKYTASSGHVWIKASQQDAGVSISVRDDGGGILPEEKPRIWDRLHRGDRSRSQPGLGLGLSMVRAIVKAHGGYVDVQSAPGQGAVFTVEFPAANRVAATGHDNPSEL